MGFGRTREDCITRHIDLEMAFIESTLFPVMISSGLPER